MDSLSNLSNYIPNRLLSSRCSFVYDFILIYFSPWKERVIFITYKRNSLLLVKHKWLQFYMLFTKIKYVLYAGNFTWPVARYLIIIISSGPRHEKVARLCFRPTFPSRSRVYFSQMFSGILKETDIQFLTSENVVQKAFHSILFFLILFPLYLPLHQTPSHLFPSIHPVYSTQPLLLLLT